MEDRILLMLGASSDVGIKYIEKYGKNYKKIYAHYNTNDSGLKKLVEEGFDNIECIQCELLDDSSVEHMLCKINSSCVMPTNIIFLPSRKTQLKKIEETSLVDIKTDLDLQIISSSLIVQNCIP